MITARLWINQSSQAVTDDDDDCVIEIHGNTPPPRVPMQTVTKTDPELNDSQGTVRQFNGTDPGDRFPWVIHKQAVRRIGRGYTDYVVNSGELYVQKPHADDRCVFRAPSLSGAETFREKDCL